MNKKVVFIILIFKLTTVYKLKLHTWTETRLRASKLQGEITKRGLKQLIKKIKRRKYILIITLSTSLNIIFLVKHLCPENAINNLNIVLNCFCHCITFHLLNLQIYLVFALYSPRILSSLIAFVMSAPMSIYFIMFFYAFFIQSYSIYLIRAL